MTRDMIIWLQTTANVAVVKPSFGTVNVLKLTNVAPNNPPKNAHQGTLANCCKLGDLKSPDAIKMAKILNPTRKLIAAAAIAECNVCFKRALAADQIAKKLPAEPAPTIANKISIMHKE